LVYDLSRNLPDIQVQETEHYEAREAMIVQNAAKEAGELAQLLGSYIGSYCHTLLAKEGVGWKYC